MVVNYEVFLFSVILRAGCNEIEPNIVNCGMCYVREENEKKKEGENKSTKWEKSRDRYMALNIRKKQLLGSGRNSAL